MTRWHELGYTGKRGKTASGEVFSGENATGHGVSTRNVFLEIAPDREVVHVPYTTKCFPETLPDAIAQGVDTMFLSMIGGNPGNDLEAAMTPYLDRFTFFVSAGNDGEERSNGYMMAPHIYGVGAMEFIWSQTYYGIPVPGATLTIRIPPYTSLSENVDFAAPTNLYERNSSFGGTSCSCPVLCGMAALVNDFFIDKTGRPLGSEGMYRFLMDNTVDIFAEGRDTSTGWGYVVLPDPETIDIWKYQTRVDEDEMTGEEIYRELTEYLWSLPESGWSQEEGAWQKAVRLGRVDGENPRGFLSREQMTALLDRLGLIK